MKDKLKSIPLWSSVLCLVALVAREWLHLDIPAWGDISTEILLILGILFGVANNPSDRLHF